jgi:glycosyltransferase involved in cell wall biosynthesis
MTLIKVAVLYRVVQDWRAPIFERLSQIYDLVVYFGPDFQGTKVISTKKEWNFKKKKLFSVKIRFNGSYGEGYTIFSPSLLLNLIKTKPLVVISEGTSNIFNAIQGFIYCKLFNKRFIWWSLGALHSEINLPKRKGLKRKIINYIETHSDAIITYSSQGKKYFINVGVPENRIFIAVNVIDTELRKLEISKNIAHSHLDDHKLNILYVGAINPAKKLDILIKACERVKLSIGNNFTLNVVGDGPSKNNCVELMQDLGLNKQITFHGQVIDEVSKYFLKSDVYVMPGLGGLGISDAMVHGLAVICTHGDGCEKDLVTNDWNGYFIDIMNTENLADAILKIYNNPQLLQTFKANSVKRINEEFNINTYITSINEAIRPNY